MKIPLTELGLDCEKKELQNKGFIEIDAFKEGYNTCKAENGKSFLVINEEKLTQLIRKKAVDIPKPIPQECILTHWKCSPSELVRYLSQNARQYLSITKE